MSTSTIPASPTPPNNTRASQSAHATASISSTCGSQRPMRYAVLESDDSKKWEGFTLSLWQAALSSPEGGDTFDVFACHKGEFPDASTVKGLYDCIVIGGSRHSAYDLHLPFIHELCKRIPAYLESGVKILGCCFGHQIVAQALGGRVTKNPSGRFVLTVEEVEFKEDALKCLGLALSEQQAACSSTTASTTSTLQQQQQHQATAASSMEIAPSNSSSSSSNMTNKLRLLESHGDQVVELPPRDDLVVLATSGTARYEALCYGPTCLTFQFHPELTCPLVHDKIWTALSASGTLNSQEAKASEAALTSSQGVDSARFLELAKNFARHGAATASGSSSADTAAATSGAGTALSECTSTAAVTCLNSTAADVAGSASALSSNTGKGQVMEPGTAEQDGSAEGLLRASAGNLLMTVQSAVAEGFKQGTLEHQKLTNMNRAVANKCQEMASIAGAMANFGAQQSSRQDDIRAALDAVMDIEKQLDRLAVKVDELDAESRALAAEVGLPEGKGTGRWLGYGY